MIYINNTSTNPFFNFALEYYLMNEKKLPENTVFLFWRTEPTLMIGRYQNTIEEINEKYVKKNKINVIRRISGGGTIYTDLGGWQYSFITKGKAEQIDFNKYVTPIVEALNKIGVGAEFNSRNDLVINNRKFSGNAQCMISDYTLHHGSLLFNTDLGEMIKSITVDEYKIISKGIKSVKERVTNIADHLKEPMDSMKFKELMVQSVMRGSKNEYKLTDEDIRRVNEISKNKFEMWEWNYGKSPKFNITKTGRFNGGKMEFKLDVNGGIIERCTVYGDFFGTVDINSFCNVLMGCKYNKESIKEALEKNNMQNVFYDINYLNLIDVIC
mgnify:CR=1 FL=1